MLSFPWRHLKHTHDSAREIRGEKPYSNLKNGKDRLQEGPTKEGKLGRSTQHQAAGTPSARSWRLPALVSARDPSESGSGLPVIRVHFFFDPPTGIPFSVWHDYRPCCEKLAPLHCLHHWHGSSPSHLGLFTVAILGPFLAHFCVFGRETNKREW